MNCTVYLNNFFSFLKISIKKKKNKIFVKKTKNIIFVLNFLYKEGYIKNYKIINDSKICIFLKYVLNESIFHDIIYYKPSRKIFFTKKKMCNFIRNKKWLGSNYILYTSKGLLSLTQCIKYNLTGILMFKIN